MKINLVTILVQKINHLTGYLKVCLLLFFLSAINIRSSAQDTINSISVEQKSYQLYQDKNWNELIKYGNKAVHDGFDYFYLQMRIGIAYYEKKNYCLAESHFKNALKFSSEDELAKEYLYYCYVFTGKEEDARMFSKSFSQNLSEKIGTNMLSPISFVMLEGGTKISDSTYYYDLAKRTYSNYFKPAVYFQLGLNHYVKNRISLFHAVTLFNQENFVGTLNQKQYYLKVAVPFKKNWLVTPAFHAIHINFSSIINTPLNQQRFTVSENYFVGSLTVQKSIRKFVLSVGYLVSDISNVTQYIHSGFISYSPLGNSKLVLGCTGYVHTINNYSSTNTALSPFIYVEPLKRISLKLSYLSNAGNNIIEDNAYLVNNSADLTKSRIGVLANFFVSKRVSLYALYQLEKKQENVQNFNYKYNVILGGIKIVPTKN